MKIWLFLMGWMVFAPVAFAQQTANNHLQICTSPEIGVQFVCNPDWKLTRLGKTLTVTISENPMVQMEVIESDMKVRFMSDLNRQALDSFGRYAPGFFIERLRHCGRETVKVNGYLKGHPDVRVSDFYLVDHLQLHMVRFTLNPKQAWENYGGIIKQIVDSLAFMKHSTNVKLITQETDEKCQDLVGQTTR